VITLRELGLAGLRRRIEEQDRQEMQPFAAPMSTDITTILPGPLGIGGARTRKIDAQHRLLIDQELHEPLLRAEVHRLYQSTEGRELVSRHVRTTRNVLKRTANALSVAYQLEPIRKVGSQKMAKAWRKAVIDGARFNMQAKRWARYAWICNVVHVIPMVIDGAVEYEEILPHAADVVFDDGDTEPSILVYLSDGAGWSRVAVDNERFWYLSDNWEIVDEVEHGYRGVDGKPMQPWVQWRVRSRMRSEDYWKRGEGRQLVDATLVVGVVAAAMAAIRQNSNRRLPVMVASNIDEDVPPGQNLTGEHPLMFRNGEFQAVDLITPVAEFLNHTNDEEGEIAEAYGVPVGVIDSSRSTKDTRWMEFQAVARHRQEMIPHLRAADLETQIKTAIIMRAEGHAQARNIKVARFAETLRVKFQKQTFLEMPSERLKFYREAMSLGLHDPVSVRMLEHPEETFEEAKRESMATRELRAEFNEFEASRNLATDAGQDADSLAQLQGRLGGMTRNTSPDGNDEQREQRDQ
jgi:ribosome biogenesis protein Tsr3